MKALKTLALALALLLTLTSCGGVITNSNGPNQVIPDGGEPAEES